MAEYKGLEYLRNKLLSKRIRVLTRYAYYEMKNGIMDYSKLMPADMRWIKATLGWCSKAVDSIADRLAFREFRNDNFDLNNIFDMNNPDTLFDSAALGALIASCSFIYLSPDEDGFPRMQVIDAANATGIMDPITGLLKEGYAVLERDDGNKPTLEAYFTRESTRYIRKGYDDEVWDNVVQHPYLVPIIYRPDARREFGRSRISRACMDIMQSALRTLKRSEVSAEFYAFPQKYVLGLAEDAEFDKWKATYSTMLAISNDENGNQPKVGQFQQQSMGPYIDQLRSFAALFAGETGLTVDDLGFVSDNPSSSEAIKASHENLRLYARKAQKYFGNGFVNAGYIAACIRDEYPYLRRQIYLTKPVWEPLFEPDAAMLSSIGDGAIKINQGVPGYFDKTNLRDLTGIDASMNAGNITGTNEV